MGEAWESAIDENWECDEPTDDFKCDIASSFVSDWGGKDVFSAAGFFGVSRLRAG